MIALVLSILCSTAIFVLFKLFEKHRINIFQAIVVNYFTAFGIGILFFASDWEPAAMHAPNWIYFVFVSSLLFIGLFLIMGISSQKNGVASTSVAVKMSMAFSMILMIVLYGESLNFLKILGILLALLGVMLVSFSGAKNSKRNSAWMLLFLFVGSGMLDFVLNYAQKNVLGVLSPALFSAFGLGCAGLIGLIILLYQLVKKRQQIHFKSILAGIVLGIPNFFSIYLLLLSYKTTGLNDSSVLALTNVGVVVCSALIGFSFFKESRSSLKFLGLVASISAIVSLYFAN
jgi:drug/metabolite transporter (DMT)-like permease